MPVGAGLTPAWPSRYNRGKEHGMPSVDKIHRILETLRQHYKTGLTNKEISQKINIPPSTSYRILAALRKYDYVRQHKKDARYYLGFTHLRLAEAVVEGMDLSAICLPYLEELHSQTEETTFFALFNGQHCVTMETCGQVDTRVAVGLGEVMPMHASAAGKAVLAFLPRKDEERILQGLKLEVFTPHTLHSLGSVRKSLAEIRKYGIATNQQEFHKGINALAAPIFNNEGRPVGSIALVGTSIDLDAAQLEEYAPLFIEAAAGITERIGGSYPPEILEFWEHREKG
jgi:IclR family KDG regulon transcriptional repressor